MFRPLSLSIGLRYTRAKRRNHFISFISLVSMLGIALGVLTLITVISVMNGFEKELRDRILGMIAHATVSGVGEGLKDWRQVVVEAGKNPQVAGAAPYIEREVMLQAGRISGGAIRGVDPALETRVSELSHRLVEGSWEALQPHAFKIMLGKELALWLGVKVGDNVLVYAPLSRVTPVGVIPVTRKFEVSGIFEAGMQEYDRYLAVVHLEDAAKLLRMRDEVTGVRLKLTDLFKSWEVARELTDRLGGYYRVGDWTREHANFFRAIKTEKAVMFMILSLVVAVAAFNLVSSLVMLVTDKQADIAILRTLGMSPGGIMAAFMLQGILIGVVGTALGVVGGSLLAMNVTNVMHAIESVFHFQLMPADVYYISDLPSDFRIADAALIAGLSLGFSAIATLYPAWRASRTEPAVALRYE